MNTQPEKSPHTNALSSARDHGASQPDGAPPVRDDSKPPLSQVEQERADDEGMIRLDEE